MIDWTNGHCPPPLDESRESSSSLSPLRPPWTCPSSPEAERNASFRARPTICKERPVDKSDESDVPGKSDESHADGLFDFPGILDFTPASEKAHRSEKDGSCRIPGKDASSMWLRVLPPQCISCTKRRWPARRSMNRLKGPLGDMNLVV